jgi:quinohemoprotein ethanol dehydrogenase
MFRLNKLANGGRNIASAALAVVLAAQVGASPNSNRNASSENDWPTHGRTYSEQRFSPLRQIRGATVKRLGLAWWAEFDTNRGQEATPLMVGGILYTTTAWSKVFAFDARTGRALWNYDPQVPGVAALHACCDVVNRGAAFWDGKLFVGTLDGRLIALDAKSGKVLWSTQTTDTRLPYTITGAPRVVKGKVLIGNGGAEYGVRGYVSAYSVDSGKLAWRFYMTPNPEGRPDGTVSDAPLARLANATWYGDVWKQSGGGGTAWDAIVYDPETDLVFIGTGNGSPWNQMIRSEGKGDNLFVSSIVAVRPDTGEYVWHYQVTPGDTWDYTATQPIMVADLTIEGRRRHVVMQAPKNGFFYVLDAKTGALISADKFAPGADWATKVDLCTGRPVERPGVRWGAASSQQNPGPLGSHNWKPMAFNPGTGLVYIPAQDNVFTYSAASNVKKYRQVNGVWNLGMGVQGVGGLGYNGGDAALQPAANAAPAVAPQRRTSPLPTSGSLVAWDPVKRQARWSLPRKELWGQGGVLAAADMVFQGVGHDLKALDAGSGRELWSYDMGAPAIAAPIAYALDEAEYVAVMVGNGGGASTGDLLRPGRLMVFKLDGAAVARPFVEPRLSALVDVATAEPSSGDKQAGAVSFRRYCTICHGSSSIWPDLRRAPAILRSGTFKAVVHEGTRQRRGMPSFATFMTESNVEDIRAYLLDAYRAPTQP